jgi:hypothetical protein
MARFVATLDSALPTQEAFAYLADVERFVEWDPSVVRSTRVEGSAPGAGASYDVEVKNGPRTVTLRYRTTEWDPPRRMLLRAETRWLVSLDEIRVEPRAGGSRVTYDASLTLKGIGRLFDPALGVVFRRIGDRAVPGLRRGLHAEGVAS